jgi:hypothetical protein
VNLNHFRLLRVVGRGAFGKVRIVERKDTNLSFALKYIRKDEGMYGFVDMLHLGLRPHSIRKLSPWSLAVYLWANLDSLSSSRPIRERPKYHSGETHVGTCEPSLHLQSALQLSRYRIYVGSYFPSGITKIW